MNPIAKLFLGAKHWQIFSLIFVPMAVGQIALATSVSAAVPTEEGFQRAATLAGILAMLFMLFLVGWFWAMGSFLSSIADPRLRLRRAFFHFALVYPPIYLPVFIAIFARITTAPGVFAIIFPLHFLVVYCTLYLLYFVSKSLVLVERGQPVSFYDYSGPFFLLWFFPLGVWVIQPRINRLYEQHGSVELSPGDSVV
ncbi:MAG TPA: hypothetical protein VEI73_00785 [Candidatus Acidoferrum sp.]|nr:hypothetical protein [Candidatus Acidoferrum sp.]